MKAEPGQNRSVRALSVATTGSEVHRYGNVKGAETSPAVFDVAGMPICSHPLINQSTAQSQEITILAQDYFVACDDTNKCDAAVAGGEQEIAQDITNIRNAVNESIHKPAKLRLNSLYTRFSSPKYLIEIHIFLVWFYQGIRQIINRFSTLFWATSITYWQKRIVSSHPFVLLLACSLSFVERTWPPKTEDPPKTHRQAAISTSEPPTTLHRDLLRVDIEDLSKSSTPTAPLPGTQSQNLPQNKLSGLGLQKNENQTHPCRICHKGFHFNQLFKHLEDSHSYVRSQVNATEISPLQKSPGLSCACGFRGRSVKPNFGRCQLVQASWRVQNGQEIGVWSAEKGQSPALSFQCTSPTGTFCPFSRPSKRDYEHPRHDDIAVGVLLWVKKRDSYPTSRRYLCANKHDSPCLLDPHKSQGHPAVVLDYRRRSGSDVVGDLELLMCPITSFHSLSLESYRKLSSSDYRREHSIPIHYPKPNETKSRASNPGTLYLSGGGNVDKQTYVMTRCTYWLPLTECQILSKKMFRAYDVRLDEHSFQQLRKTLNLEPKLWEEAPTFDGTCRTAECVK